MAPDILWQGMLIYIQEVFWIEDQGEDTLLSCTLRFSYFRTSFSFSLWLGEWDHFTRRTETFQKISNMYGYFLYILHCMDFSVNFRWWGEGGMVTAAGPSCGPSAQGVKPPSVLRPGCCCYMQEIAPVDYWHQAHSSSLGGPRHFGTGLTLSMPKRHLTKLNGIILLRCSKSLI